MAGDEKYAFEIGEEGLDYASLDMSFNPTTQAFILNAGIQPGMKVLDIGCGAGVMTAWLAKQVGPKGHVTALDNSAEQLAVTEKTIQKEKLKNVQTQVLSAYDIHSLGQEYDLIYCRFLLHHLHSPRKAIHRYYENLAKGGIYIGEEGVMNMAFAYPPTFAWRGYEPNIQHPDDENEGENRDGDIGMKLFYICRQAGFEIMDCKIVQPVFWRQSQKILLRDEMLAFKKTDLAQGTTEQEWQKKYDEMARVSNDDNQIVGFYGSCQVAAKKM